MYYSTLIAIVELILLLGLQVIHANEDKMEIYYINLKSSVDRDDERTFSSFQLPLPSSRCSNLWIITRLLENNHFHP